jgi:hypothetical protein
MMTNEQKKLDRIQIDCGSDPDESLTQCLQAILRAFGRSMVCPDKAAFSHPDLAANSSEQDILWAEHFQVTSVARACGLEVRDLHPPDAAPVPTHPPEFDLHWHDSYLPFVREALHRDEPVLARDGWPEGSGKWGIITAIDDQGHCSGHTCAGFVSMTGPSILAYVFSEKS